MKLPARKQRDPSPAQYERAALKAMAKGDAASGTADAGDGSRRLLRYCRAAKRFGFHGEDGVRIVRIHLVQQPLPREYTDAQILKRIQDADVELGEGCEESVPPWEPQPTPKPEKGPKAKTKMQPVEVSLNSFALDDTKGFLGEYIDLAMRTAKRPQPIFALAGGIALVAALTGRKLRDAFGTRTNVQLIVVGKTASGKDYCRQLNNSILAGTDQTELIAPEEFTSDTAVYQSLADHPCRLVQLDEFGRFLMASQGNGSSHLRGVVTAMMKMFTSAGSAHYAAKSYANKKERPDIVISYPHLVLHASSTPDAVYAAMGSTMVEDGFLGRCFLLESSSQPRLQMVPEEPFSWSMREFAEIWRDEDSERVATTSDDALAILAEAEEMSHRKLIGGERSANLWGRFSQKARQMALIAAASRWDGGEIAISGEDARWGVRLTTLVTEQMIGIAREWLAENATESAVQKLFRIIKAHPGISTNQLTRRSQWARQGERQEIIDTLIQSGQIRWEEEKTAGPTKLTYFPVNEE